MKKNITITTWLNVRDKINNHDIVLIDTRSESEFQKGHIPLAINIPLLNDIERHNIGITYKKTGKNEAVACGLEQFSKKASLFLKEVTQKNDFVSESKIIVVYCWRGGLRSRLTAAFLAAANFDVLILDGGYKSFRNIVLDIINIKIPQHSLLVLNGLTGTGKTRLLEHLSKKNLGTLNFEALANHKGSVFGDFSYKTPSVSPQNFENNLANAYLSVCEQKTLIVELESHLGCLKIPPNIRKKMINSPIILVSRELSDRLNILKNDYCLEWTVKKEKDCIERLLLLKKKFSNELFEQLLSYLKKQDFYNVIKLLLSEHYDKAYQKSLSRYSSQVIQNFNLSYQYKEALLFIQQKVSHQLVTNTPN